MKYISLNDQLIKERQKNAALDAEIRKSVADIDYIAMMCDVDLETNDGGENAQNEEE